MTQASLLLASILWTLAYFGGGALTIVIGARVISRRCTRL